MNQNKMVNANKNEVNEWKIVQKGKGLKNKTNTSKHTDKTPKKTLAKPYQENKTNSNPPATKNPYAVLWVLEGIDRENIEYNMNISENDAIDMEVNEEVEEIEAEDEINIVLKKAKSMDR